VRFSLSEPGIVEMSVFDISGRCVIENGAVAYPAGHHAILLDGLVPGVYLCRVVSDEFTGIRRFAVVK
jgi:hypothetical protein